LDDLRAEFDAIKADRSTRRIARLDEFHEKLSKLTFLDPACGCGNFLVITYRELRALELEILNLKFGKQQEMTLDQVNKLSLLDVDQRNWLRTPNRLFATDHARSPPPSALAGVPV